MSAFFFKVDKFLYINIGFANKNMLIPLQRPRLPEKYRSIVSIGAGEIVTGAHLPAYKIAGFRVASIYDRNMDRAKEVAFRFGIPHICRSFQEAVDSAPPDAIFDLALPANSHLESLNDLPFGVPVLIQKPLGENIEQARLILSLCHSKQLKAGVNFQLRYAPYILAARSLIEGGVIGELHDVEVRMTVYTPWHLWSFLEGLPRMEILYHSVHYIDLIRSFLGEPIGVWAHTVKHPKTTLLASTRTNIIFNYGNTIRANITTNHDHEFGAAHQESYVKFEGTKGAIKIRIGLLLNYPQGAADALEYCTLENSRASEWKSIPLEGSWYPHAFIGTMSDLMRFANDEIAELPTSAEDAFRTMAVVEAAYLSSASGGTTVRSS